MKKILSLVLAVIMLVSAVPMVYAAENETDHTNGTYVTYAGTGIEEYTVTVPAELAPGASGNVVIAGTWNSRRKLVVSADATVTLRNNISASDTKELAVTFQRTAISGSNTAAVTKTLVVSVDDIDNALFGTWFGTFHYNVEMQDNTGPIIPA